MESKHPLDSKSCTPWIRCTPDSRPFAVGLAAFETVVCALLPAGAAEWTSRWLLPDWFRHELRAAASAWPTVPRQHIPDGRDTLRALNDPREWSRLQGQESRERIGAGSIASRIGASEGTSSDGTTSSSWGVLLPLTSRGTDDEDALWHRLECNLDRLVQSVLNGGKPPHAQRRTTTVYVAIDLRDPVFDSDHSRARITRRLHALQGAVFLDPLVPAYQGALCWIWALLAKRAARNGADHLVLLGDDVEMLTDGWQADVEECFGEIARERALPYGCACVALRDVSFECFPTFPVVHRFHLDANRGELFPPEFRNQHGDPFLYEVYRRWGAARYARRAELNK